MSKAKSLSNLMNLVASASLLAAVSGLPVAQQVALPLGSGRATPGRSVSLSLSSEIGRSLALQGPERETGMLDKLQRSYDERSK